jgi:hypothetical protein
METGEAAKVDIAFGLDPQLPQVSSMLGADGRVTDDRIAQPRGDRSLD